jgi:hypothetical protein
MKKFLKFIYAPPSVEYSGTESISRMGLYPVFNKVIVRFDVGKRKELHIYDEDWNLINKYDRYSKWEDGYLGNSKNRFRRAQFKKVHIIGKEENDLVSIYFPDDNGSIMFDYEECNSEYFKRDEYQFSPNNFL